MYTTSNDFKTAINNPSRKFECKVMCGNKTYTNVNIVSINITGSLQPSGYTIGSAISQKATFKFINDGTVTFPSDTISLQIGLMVGSAYEYVPIGSYTIDSHDSDDYTITITAYDNMTKLEGKYNGTGTNLRAIAQEICTSCGITLGSTIPTTTVSTPTSGKYTNREVIGYVAGCMGGNAVIDREGKLKIQKLNLSTIDKQVTTDNWFTYKNADMIFDIEELICDTGNGVKLTSGSTTDKEKQLTIKNPLMTQAMLDVVKVGVSNTTFTGFNVKYQGDISTDLGDTVKIIDRKGQTLTAPLLQRTINYNGGLTENIKTEGKKKVDLASSYYGSGRYGLDFSKLNFDMQDFNLQLDAFGIDLGNFELALTGLTDRVAALENGGTGGNNISEYVIDTSLTNKTLTFTLQAATGATIATDWGDGTTDNNLTHTYATNGKYTIKTTSPYPPRRDIVDGDIWQECLIEIIKLSEAITYAVGGFINYVNLKKVGDILGVVNAEGMFKGCTSLKYPGNVGDKIKNCKQMYYGCTSLVDVSTYRDTMENTSSMYNGCTSLEFTGDMADNIENAEGMFANCTGLKKISHLSSSLENAISMFSGCTGLKMIGKNIDLPNSIKYGDSMFFGCINLNANVYYPSALETAKYMFKNCTSMENFRDTVNLIHLTDMEQMYQGCTSSDFSALTKCPPNANNLSWCFEECTELQLPSNFFSNVVANTNANSCFRNCTNLTNRIDVPTNFMDVESMFESSGVTQTTNTIPSNINYDYMYKNCASLTTISTVMYELMQDNTKQGLDCFKNCTNITSPDSYNNLSNTYSSWF